jgi:hypothetical protein
MLDDLPARILDPSIPIAEIARELDGLAPDARKSAVLSLGRAHQRALYDKAIESPARLADFVPEAVPALKTVVHQGRNTLPVPGPFARFEKRFCRGGDDAPLYGFNEGITRPFIGPGYFVAKATEGHAEWAARGAVVVDYFEVPRGPVPEGWPPVVPNTRGLQRFVFHHTRDFMRRVTEGITIGAAYKVEKKLDHYFLLVRED